ncbi:f-box domain protein [Phlyctema vagabunda]|uniref:F-box domain protein n=1 Tax=Phlyctema vagabunda TaxID=108571 RepID=A0ABR4PHR3_9HELO
MLYDVNSMVLNTAPISEVPTTASQQTWCTNFLSVNRLAIGVGSCKDPLEIYDIDETGQVVKNNSHIPFPSTTSVFAIQPLCKTSTAAGSLPGNVFLTGSHDGWCRLVDLRDQDGIVTNYQDHIENFPYYSLALIGQERFIAGSSQESRLTVYDLRMGNKAYHYTDALPCLPRSPFPNPPRLPPASANTRATCFQDMESSAFLRCRFHEEAIKRVYDPNFRIDLGPKETWKTSPVYSLCSPSHLYPHIYAGVQDHVLELRLDGGSEANAANRQESLRRRKTSKEYLTYPFKENQFLLGMTEVPEEASARAYVPLQRGLDSSPVCIPYAYRDLDQDAEHRHRLDPQWHLEKDHWNFKE